MAIIYKTVQETLRRHCSSPQAFIQNVQALLTLYTPKDQTKEKQNLLTLYLNAKGDLSQLDSILKSGYELQLSAGKFTQGVEGEALERIVLWAEQQQTVLTVLAAIKGPKLEAYKALMLPSIQRYTIWKHVHTKGMDYEKVTKSNIFFDMFEAPFGRDSFKNRAAFQNFLKETAECMLTLVKDRCVTSTTIDVLLDPRMQGLVFKGIMHYQIDLDYEDEIRKVLGNVFGHVSVASSRSVDPVNDNFQRVGVWLQTIHRELTREYLQQEQENPRVIVKKSSRARL